MSKLSKREKGLLIVLLIALTGMIYYNFVLKDFISEYTLVNAEIADTQVRISDSKQKETSIRMVDEKLEQLHMEIDNDLNKVLGWVNRPEIIRMLDSAMAGIVSDPSYYFPAGYITLPGNHITTVEVVFNGTEDQTRNVLKALGRTDYVNRVLIAEFRYTNNEEGSGSARLEIEILTRDLLPVTE
ncbi:MAG: hypothetical protein WCR87_07125 [Saccharofermentanales bacterium]